MIKIKAVISALSDQCSWYRGAGPLNRLIHDYNDVQVEYITKFRENDWYQLTDCDILFVLRPYSEEHLSVIKVANSCSIPVVIDYDDNLFFTGEHAWLEHKEMSSKHEIIKECVARAQWVTVSTRELLQVYGPYCSEVNIGDVVKKKNITLIPNGFDSKTLFYQKTYMPHRQKILAWRGSETHDPDLAEVSGAFIDTMNAQPDWVTHFYWGNPKFISYYIKSKHEVFGPTQFMLELYKARPKILTHPLQDNEFNRAKSNAAWIEATMAGALFLGRNLPEFVRPNSFMYNNDKEFGQLLSELMHLGEEQSQSQVILGQQYILENLELGNLNKERRKIFAEFKR